jgi:hypothetical protein
MKKHDGMETQLHAFLTSTVDGGGQAASAPNIHWIGGALERVWTLWSREKLSTAGDRTPAVQPVGRCYTD